MSKSFEKMALEHEARWKADNRHRAEPEESDDETPPEAVPLSRAELKSLLQKSRKEGK